MQPPTIRGFDFIQPLGGGPMSIVWSAREHATDDAVAVKTPRLDGPEPEVAMEILRREARCGLAVRHAQLVRYRSASLDRPPQYIVMDFVEGESLRDRLKRDRRLDAPTALWVARQTAEALAAIHHAGFVHGDVKPENVRLTGGGTATLIDLGFAHKPGENAEFFARGLILGTANYLAPEICALDARADGASDVFSLGVALFESLTGRLPYPKGTTNLEVMKLHRETLPDDLSNEPGRWSIDLVELVRRMMSRRAADRPGASVLAQELMALEIESIGGM